MFVKCAVGCMTPKLVCLKLASNPELLGKRFQRTSNARCAV